MVKPLLHLIGLFLIRKDPRRRFLLSQYLRAKLLPNWAIQVKKNKQYLGSSIDISILVTCYNYSQYIQLALNSIIQSQLNDLNIEIIVVNDASTDKSQEVLESYLDLTPHPLLIVKTCWNVGLTKARNIALQYARGQYVFILDADNIIEPSALSLLHNRAELTQSEAVFGTIQRVLADGTEHSTISHEPFNANKLTGGNYIDAMALIRTDTLINLGGYDLELLKIIGGWEDYDIWLNFANRSIPVGFEPTIIGNYLVKPDSMVTRISSYEISQAFQHFRKKYTNLPWS